uniref:C2H2-type domain-containing protein n=1 Tax=Globodera rostochiensis TaxID=31243 RepID=A0A914HE28_GLORO
MAKQQIISTGGRKLSTPAAYKRSNIRQDSNRHKEDLVGGKTSTDKQHKCAYCPKTFVWPSQLKQHKRYHTGKRPFQCKQCKKRFHTVGNLNVHLRTHSGVKPFKCAVCDLSLSGDLKKHSRIHSGEKPFKCDVCDKRFYCSGSLKKHSRIHSGEKPYKCAICDKQFSQSSNLKTHSRIHHGEKPFKKYVKVVIVRHEMVTIVRQEKTVRYETMLVRRP